MRVCVYSGSHLGFYPRYLAAAKQRGRDLARHGLHVVYGGASVGLMGALADAVLDAGGTITGVISEALADLDIAHPRLPDLRVVATMHARKALMADLADAFIALPGGIGTLEELFEAVSWAQLGHHAKPCVLYDVGGYYAHLVGFLDAATAEGFLTLGQQPG